MPVAESVGGNDQPTMNMIAVTVEVCRAFPRHTANRRKFNSNIVREIATTL